MRRVLLIIAPTLALALGPVALAAPDPSFTITNPEIAESSGLVASVHHPGVVWTHNDNPATHKLFALDATDGRVLATFTVKAPIHDFEAISMGFDSTEQPELLLGDVGDNDLNRKEITIWRLPEPPALTGGEVTPVPFKLAYPDGSHDSEALLVNPEDGRIYVVTKSEQQNGALYAAPGVLAPRVANALTRIRPIPWRVTDGAFAPDGRILLRTYKSIYVLSGIRGGLMTTITLPVQPQGESIAVLEGGKEVLVGSEGRNSKVFRVKLPPAAAPTPSIKPAPLVTDESPVDPVGIAALAGLGVLALGSAVAVLLRSRRRR